MILRNLSLRLKLVAALVLPLIIVAGYLAVSVNDAIGDRSVAQNQLDEVRRFEAVTAYAQTLGAEVQIMNGTDMGISLLDHRAEVDRQFAQLSDAGLGITSENLALLNGYQAEVGTNREVLGDTVAGMQAGLGAEVAAFEPNGPFINAYTRFSEFSGEVSATYEIDPDNIANARTTDLLTSYEAVLRYQSQLSREFSNMAGTAPLPGAAVGDPVTGFLDTQAGRTQEARATLFDLAIPEVRAEVQVVLDSDDFATFDENMAGLAALSIGGEPSESFNIVAATPAAVASIGQIAAISDGIADDVRTEADNTLDNANSQLIRAAAIGGLLLLLVTVILFVLYRAIRRPLLDVTEQSQRISEVELPQVVQAMRAGEIDSVPEIVEIEAFTNDEIGDLVSAFNGMHRTAVELAAEQAGSRRVVADMFVNLGRRNQKLLNRMLKGLGQLEQSEQDPDKLEALYKVDHLATRMRRNAESLLILAGASQSRSWSKPVPVYDVVQAALSEVENFDRVDVDASDGEMINGGFIADLAHMIAELTENALAFSPPTTQVTVMSRATQRGYVIAISDRGVGLTADEIALANERITAAASEDETPSEFLGLYVVGRLAARRGFKVDLLEGLSGGVTARIIVPVAAIFDPAAEAAADAGAAAALAAAAPAPVRVEQPVAEPAPMQPPVVDTPPTETAPAVVAAPQAPLPEVPAPQPPTFVEAPVDAAPVAPVEAAPDVAAPVAPVQAAPVASAPVEPMTGAHDALPVRGATPAPAASMAAAPAPVQPAAPEAVSTFGPRRTPGQNMPSTNIQTSSSWSESPELGDPDEVRASLAGFQTSTAQADKESN